MFLSRAALPLASIFIALVMFSSVNAIAVEQGVATFYKGKTITITVGFTPGGGYDVYARLLARYLARRIPGEPTVVVQNMPGAASLKSVQYLESASSDGTFITTFNPSLILQSLTSPDRVPVNFLNYSWIGNVSEDFRVCYAWYATGIKNWQDFLARDKVTFGNTSVGGSAYIDIHILSELLGVKVRAIMGYPGSADERLAMERGEIDGECGSWTSIPEDWLLGNKVSQLIRFTPTMLPGMAKDMPYAGNLLSDPTAQKLFRLLTSGAVIGRPYVLSGAVPADRIATLRKAFDDTMTDPEFRAEAARLGLPVAPMSGGEVETNIRQLYQSPPDIIEAAKKISGN
jgi:tripartite-type tricarboxylate transporter receptor subunit TctC